MCMTEERFGLCFGVTYGHARATFFNGINKVDKDEMGRREREATWTRNLIS